jgi:tight adherence protein B
MILLVPGFLAILLVTFGLIIAVTRLSPEQKTIEIRIASIQPSTNTDVGSTTEATQLLKVTNTGKFDWFDEILEQYQFSRILQTRIRQADSSTTVATLILSSLGLFFSGYVIAWFFAPMVLIDIAVGVGLSCLPYGIISLKRSRRTAAFNAVLAESIDMLARGLRAGYSLVGAIEMLSENAQEPAASEFREIFKQQNLGMPLREALMQILYRVPSLDLRVLVTAILVQKDTGGNLTEILDRTVFVIRERQRIQGEIRTHTAQGRLTGWILSALPVVMLVLVNLVNPGYSSILLHDPLGHKIIYISLTMLIVGSLIIRSIINGIEV